MKRLRVEDLVFVDESGITTKLTRLYGRAPAGERALGRAPAGDWKLLTVLGGLSLQGLVACMSIESATDTPVVVAFVREVLVPVLRAGQVVILDNLSPHKASAVRELIEGAGCRLLLLPPYSPDLNPIEQQAEDAPAGGRRANEGGPGGSTDGRDRADHGRRCPRMVRPRRLQLRSTLTWEPL